MVFKVVYVNTLDLAFVQRGLSLGLLHVKAQGAVQVFKGGEAGGSKLLRFDGSIIIYIVENGCCCQGAAQCSEDITEAIVGPNTGC